VLLTWLTHFTAGIIFVAYYNNCVKYLPISSPRNDIVLSSAPSLHDNPIKGTAFDSIDNVEDKIKNEDIASEISSPIRDSSLNNTTNSLDQQPGTTSRRGSRKDPQLQLPQESEKRYLTMEPELQQHHIWKGKGFWESALMERTATEMAQSPPVLWDELAQETLHEAVIGFNITISFHFPPNFKYC